MTGGAGFIGGHLVDTLLQAGANVRVIDDLSNSTMDTLADDVEMRPDRLRFIYGSILDDRAIDEAVEGAGAVIHLAAIGSVPRSIEDPGRAFAVNATGTLRVLEAARRNGVGRVVLAASSSAYGNPACMPCREDMPIRPLSPYAASKAAAEELCRAWSACYGLSTVCLRYFNVFGPRQRADSDYAAVVAAFARRLLAGEAPVIYGDGSQSRDFTFIANAVYATVLAATSPSTLSGQAVNIGAGGSCSVLELAGLMARRLAPDAPPPVLRDPRPGDVRDSRASIELAGELLGYEPIVSLEEGLDQTCDWYRQSTGAGSLP